MLNKIEKKLMVFILEKCGESRKSILLTPQELLGIIKSDYDFNEKQLAVALNNISLDGYIEVVSSDNKGSHVYIISLKPKGTNYIRESEQNKKKLYLLIGRTVLLATLTFAVTMILKLLFS